MVKHVIPASYQDALRLLSQDTYQVIAGGTDLMVQNRSSSGTPVSFSSHILYGASLSELKYVRSEETHTAIGAMLPLADILQHPETPPLLKRAIERMASPGIRHIATLAGNVGNASPAGDSLVVLYLLDALVVLGSMQGERRLKVSEYITGPGQTARRPHEMIREMLIPRHSFTHSAFFKVGGKKAGGVSKVSFAGAARFEQDRLADLRLAWGAVYKTVLRKENLEARYQGMSRHTLKMSIPSILADYAPLIQPIDDQRSNRAYRKQVSLNLLEHFLKESLSTGA